MSFTRWINEDGKQQKIALVQNDRGEFIHDTDISWQLYQQNITKIAGGKTVIKGCLGAVKSVNDSCSLKDVDIKPACSLSRIAKQVEEGCQRCKATFVHAPCSVGVKFQFKGAYGILKNKNVHTHGTYQAKHLGRETVEKLEQRILEYPAETPKGLLVGSSAKRPLYPPQPVRDIEQCLQHLGRVWYHRREILARNGLSKNGTASLESVMAFIQGMDKECQGYFQSPMDTHPQSFCILFCSPIICASVDFSNNPMVTDVTFSWFGDNYYLCTTTM